MENKPPSSSEGIFAGLKVIDCASFIAAPVAAAILADFGADVIKIEPPGIGDSLRNLQRISGMPPAEIDYFWVMAARGKRSLALDLKQQGGHEILARLLADADIFITNYPLPIRAKLGIRFEDLGARYPKLIYASLTAYGEVGPDADRSGYDSTAWWARSGMMDLVRPGLKAEPVRSMPGMGDHPTGMALYAAIATALYRRERSGRGGLVHTSLLANGIWANASYTQAKLCGAEITPRPPRSATRNALTNSYQSRDGRWFLLIMLAEERLWPLFLQAFDRPDLGADPRFGDAAQRRSHVRALSQELEQLFAGLNWAQIEQRLRAYNITYSAVARLDDVIEDPQAQACGALIDSAAPGVERTIDSPLWLQDANKTTPQPAPAIGEHSDEILDEHDYDQAAITAFRKSGIIR